jgi:hypothetical protein
MKPTNCPDCGSDMPPTLYGCCHAAATLDGYGVDAKWDPDPPNKAKWSREGNVITSGVLRNRGANGIFKGPANTITGAQHPIVPQPSSTSSAMWILAILAVGWFLYEEE